MQGKLANEMKILRASDKVAEQLPQFVQEWYLLLKGSDKSASSCYEYIRRIRQFLEYISNDVKEMNTNEITLDACESFMISCQTIKERDGMEVQTSCSYKQSLWSILNHFCNFLAERGYIEYNYMNRIPRTKLQGSGTIKKDRIILTKKDFNKVLNASKTVSKHPDGLLSNRDVLIVLLFMTTGIKRGTMSAINIDDIDIDNQLLYSKDSTGQPQTYPLNKQVIECLNKWLDDRKKLKVSELENALFISVYGKRLGDDTMYNIVRQSCRKGLKKTLSPNEIRSAFYAMLYDKTHDIEFVRRVAGHKNIQTTQRLLTEKGDERTKALKIMSDIINI